MPVDVVMGAAALVFAVIAGAWFFEGYEARKQARALDADDRARQHWGIPAELSARREAQAIKPKAKRKRRSA